MPGRASIERITLFVGLLSLVVSLLSGCGGSGSNSAFVTEPGGGTFYFIGTPSDPVLSLTYPPNPRNVTLAAGVATNVPADPTGYTHIPSTAYTVAPVNTVIVTGTADPATLSIVVPKSAVNTVTGSPNSVVELEIFTFNETTSTWVPLPGSLTTLPPTGSTVTLTGQLFTDPGTDSGLSSSGIYQVFENTQGTKSSLAIKS
jgi:hypothetical protein